MLPHAKIRRAVIGLSRRLRRAGLPLALLFALVAPAANATGNAADSVYLEELTSSELRDRVAAGATTILVPIGGTEQNGPHMVLGKHNVRAHLLAGKVARELGNTLVAPVIAYVPEGAIHPPVGHMRFAGTISIPEAAFESLLESTAKSFRQHGFRRVIFLGDHGDYQTNMERVAVRLNRAWSADPACRAYALREYYRAGQDAYAADLKSRGFSDAEIGTHAGLADTALSMALDPALVRGAMLAAKTDARDGVHGDPRRATAELGELGVKRIVESTVAAIRALPQASSNKSKTKGK